LMPKKNNLDGWDLIEPRLPKPRHPFFLGEIEMWAAAAARSYN